MPKNNDLTPVKLPMKIGFNEDPETGFADNLRSIRVKIIDCPTPEQLLCYLPQFLEATWAPHGDAPLYQSNKDKVDLIQKLFDGEALPTALETISITFQIEGISLQEVTHIIRHRTGSFSADCSGDKWWHKKSCLVPESVYQSKEIFERYIQVVKDSKQLYQDMIDTKQISIMDARSILTRNLETFYFMRMNVKDAIAFIKQRQDKQIQPETDNIIAYQMMILLVDHIPWLANKFDMHAPSWFYQKMARTGKATNLYFPDEDSDTFDYNEGDFIYQEYRDDMKGTDYPEGCETVFMNMFNSYKKMLDKANKRGEALLSNLSRYD